MHVLIIGGGLAGLAAAASLRKKFPSELRLTLIEPKNYIEVPWATIRALFDTQIRQTSTFQLSSWAAKYNVTQIRASATSLTTTAVTLDNGSILAFDFCIIAAGAITSVPSLARRAEEKELEARRARMEADGKRYLNASSVLIVGGGAIGAEFAGDIAGYARREGKKVNVTLVHSAGHLVPEFSPKAAAKLKRQLDGLGVRVVLNERAEQKDGKWTLTGSGEVIEADEVIKSIGLQPCNGFLREGGLGSSLDEKGWIKTDDQFRVEGGQGRLFAVGDCCNQLANTGVNAMGQKGVIANNVGLALEALRAKRSSSTNERKMKHKTPGPPVFLVTAGPDSGVLGTPFGATMFLLPAIKNRNMFIFRARAELGL